MPHPTQQAAAAVEMTVFSLFPGTIASVEVAGWQERDEMPGLWYWVLLWVIFAALSLATLSAV